MLVLDKYKFGTTEKHVPEGITGVFVFGPVCAPGSRFIIFNFAKKCSLDFAFKLRICKRDTEVFLHEFHMKLSNSYRSICIDKAHRIHHC